MKSMLIALCLLVSQASFAYSSVSGYVTNQFRYPLSGMYMCVQGPWNSPVIPGFRCSYTNPYGYYAMWNLYPGTYTISAQGYGVRYSQYVWIQGPTTYNFVF